jgi:MFS family permease
MTLMKVIKPAQGVGAPQDGVDLQASTGRSGKPLIRPEFAYVAIAAGVLIVGAIAGIYLDDPKRPYHAPDGISVFAVLLIAAQTVERLLEPIAPFFGTTKAACLPSESGANGQLPTGRVTKAKATKARDRALAQSLVSTDSLAAAIATTEAAWWQELLDQTRRNTATLWALASALGMAFAGGLGVLLLQGVGAARAPRWLDIIVTGIAIGGGSKPLHDLIQNIQKSKEKKENPSEATGQSAS